MLRRLLPFLLTLATVTPALRAADTQPAPLTLTIDASHPGQPLPPIWRFFGYDEANFTYMPDGQNLLHELGQLATPAAPVYIRCHHLFTSGDPASLGMKWGSTNIYTESPDGSPIYDFTTIDKIFDAYKNAGGGGVKPYVQLGFMPKALSTRPDLYPTPVSPDLRVKEDGGQAYPPKDFNKWRTLCKTFTTHLIERYGHDEVNTWFFEVWNEPDILYWKGTRDEYFKLYDFAIDGVRQALPTAKVGGPETAGNEKFTTAFLAHCYTGHNEATNSTGSPLDFISFHAKGNPTFPDKKFVRMGLGTQLARIDKHFAAIEASPFPNLPVVIGESDPDGMAARPVSEAPQLGYRNTSQFAAYTADAITRTLDLANTHHTHILGALTWSFEFENKPFFPGFRILSTHGIDLPVFNTFKMLAKMTGNRLAVTSSAPRTAEDIAHDNVRTSPDINALAALDNHQLAILVYNYHDDAVDAPNTLVRISLQNLPDDPKTAIEYRIDHEHSNAYTVWQSMGSPQSPTVDQQSELKAAGQLQQIGAPFTFTRNHNITIGLPPQSVSLLTITWK